MFSLHIDTARTWRGGQNQVLTTLMGLRSLGHRTLLVAHTEGQLRQRAAEGLDLVPLAPKTEMDLTAALRLSRLLKQLKPDIVHAHDPAGRRLAVIHYFDTGKQKFLDRYHAGWLVVDRSRYHVDPHWPLVYEDARYALYHRPNA